MLAGPGAGSSGSGSGGRGFRVKSKSAARSPRIFAFSRTSGRGSGRPSVLGSIRWPPRKSSSMNLLKASNESTWWSMWPRRAYGLITSAGTRMPYPLPSTVRRRDVVVEAAPVVPRQEDRGAVPVGSVHHGVDQPGHIALPGRRRSGRVLRVDLVRNDPGHVGEMPATRGGKEVGDVRDVARLTVATDVGERRQRIPDLGRRARDVLWGGAPVDVVAPAHVVPVHQPGEVGPGVVAVLGKPLGLAGRRQVAAQGERVGQVRLAQVEPVRLAADAVALEAARYAPEARRRRSSRGRRRPASR